MFDKLKNLFNPDQPPAVSSTESEQQQAALQTDEQVLARWSTRLIDDRRVDVFCPQLEAPPQAAVLFLHGHGQVMLNDNPIYSRLFLEHNLLAVCPDGKRSWWLDAICPDFDPQVTPQRWLLDVIVPFIEQEFSIATPSVAVCGVSMGGQGALQLSYRHASRFPVVAAIAPAVDFHQMYGHGLPLDQMFPDLETARQATVVLNLHPLAWPRHQFFCCDPADHEWFDGCARLGMKLSSSGILHERDLETSAGGHSWDYFNHMAARVMEHISRGLNSVG